MVQTVGVLALQGAFAKHIAMFRQLGLHAKEVRQVSDLDGVHGLCIPGGESTAMSKMMVRWDLLSPLKERLCSGMPVLGTCAGLILLSNHVRDWEELPRLGGLDVTVQRNAYGRQIDSFGAPVELNLAQDKSTSPYSGVFIRAPRIEEHEVGADVEILGTRAGEAVLVRQGNILAATFHPELTDDDRIHRWFINTMMNS
ncbi:MAG: pyridoxal 5'-phosphate synthase glutaminase subunit PdxT [Spirochaetales bacterium]|nr:pyridoxal 5'-phosphate synthase glutaminase subunit PdxT [Spirochaetales bacterium]